MEYTIIFIVLLLAVLLVSSGILISYIIAPSNPTFNKNSPYECGEFTIGTSWMHFNIGFYLFALLFLLFDIESVLLFPWTVVLRDVGLIGFIEIFIFLLILFIGLLYAWRKGALEWK